MDVSGIIFAGFRNMADVGSWAIVINDQKSVILPVRYNTKQQALDFVYARADWLVWNHLEQDRDKLKKIDTKAVIVDFLKSKKIEIVKI